MDRETKMKYVSDCLDEIKSMVSDYIELYGENIVSDKTALELIKTAIERYEEMSKSGDNHDS